MRFLFIILFVFSNVYFINSQVDITKKNQLIGNVMDYKSNPIKGAHIFVDSLKTNAKTNKKGIYKIDLYPGSKMITVFSFNHGMMDMEYTGQNKINFIFPKDNQVITKKEFADLGYGASKYKSDEKDYSSYSDIFQLLNTKFPNVRVVGETITIRGGGTSMTGNNTPLFFVNGSEVSSIGSIAPADIKSIIVSKGKTSLYGSRGANGFIKIELK